VTREERAVLWGARIFADNLIFFDRQFALHDQRSVCCADISAVLGDKSDPLRGILVERVLPNRVLVGVFVSPKTVIAWVGFCLLHRNRLLLLGLLK